MKHAIQTLTLCTALGVSSAGAQQAEVPQEAIVAADAACMGDGCRIETSAATTAPAAPSPQKPRQVGEATRSLMQQQAQGVGASTQQYTMAGTVAQKVYERYVNSFKHPIPEHSTSAIAKVGQGGK